MLRLLLIGILLIFASAFLIHYWEDIDNEIRFLSYYDKPAQKYGLDEIQVLLGTLHELPDAYEMDKFDCTEMSAYLEWRLENYGYHTIMVAGRIEEGKSRHAWLLVEFEKGIYIPIEPTSCQLVMPNSPLFMNYYLKHTMEFETIKEAIEFSPTEYDWWNKE